MHGAAVEFRLLRIATLLRIKSVSAAKTLTHFVSQPGPAHLWIWDQSKVHKYQAALSPVKDVASTHIGCTRVLIDSSATKVRPGSSFELAMLASRDGLNEHQPNRSEDESGYSLAAM